jgi:hypothetical protein
VHGGVLSDCTGIGVTRQSNGGERHRRALGAEPAVLSLFLKCLLGAGAVLLIALLFKSRSFFVAGLVPSFPTFALIAHYIVGTERSAQDLRATALFGEHPPWP